MVVLLVSISLFSSVAPAPVFMTGVGWSLALFYFLIFLLMTDFDVFGVVDFATFSNAREVARLVYRDDLASDFSTCWVGLKIRGVAVQYDVSSDFAYASVGRGDGGSALFDFDWSTDEERYTWSR